MRILVFVIFDEFSCGVFSVVAANGALLVGWTSASNTGIVTERTLMVSLHGGVRPITLWTKSYTFPLQKVDDVNGVNIGACETVGTCTVACGTVNVTNFTRMI